MSTGELRNQGYQAPNNNGRGPVRATDLGTGYKQSNGFNGGGGGGY